MENMTDKSIYEYNQKQKQMSGLIMISFFLFAGIVISLFYLYFSRLDLLKGTFIESILIYLKFQITNGTLFGVFILSAIGGLFFLPTPLELAYTPFIFKQANVYVLLLVYMFGLCISYGINLLIGYKFANGARKIISTKKFYQIKTKINTYGKYAVFLMNVIPLFPSQWAAVILGVFKYNKYKFMTQFLMGQLVKMVLWTGFFVIIKPLIA